MSGLRKPGKKTPAKQSFETESLLEAAAQGSLDTVKTLIAHGGDANVEFKDKGTAFFQACMHQRLDVMAYLLREQKAVTYSKDSYLHPFVQCALQGKVDALKFLIKNGAASPGELKLALQEIYYESDSALTKRTPQQLECLKLLTQCYFNQMKHNPNYRDEVDSVLYKKMPKCDSELFKMVGLAKAMQAPKQEEKKDEQQVISQVAIEILKRAIDLYRRDTDLSRFFVTAKEKEKHQARAILETMKGTLEGTLGKTYADPANLVQYIENFEKQAVYKEYVDKHPHSALAVAVFLIKSQAWSAVASHNLLPEIAAIEERMSASRKPR